MMQSDCAKIFFWGARALYLGEAFGLGPHRNAVAVLCTGLARPFEVAIDPETPEGSYVRQRMLLIPANTMHHFRITTGTMAFLYLDTHSSDYTRLRECAAVSNDRVACRFSMETRYITVLETLAAGKPWSEIKTEIAATLGLEKPVHRDERVAEALRRLRDDPGGTHSLEELARQACLSPSRFQHLFKETTGVAVRRYKLWNRMGCAVRAIASGTSLTNAALGAGFSSLAHFSTAFGEMFGMPPTRLAQTRLQIEESSAKGT